MKFSKTNSSSFRYFIAGLKPYGKVTFWGPLTVLGLLGFAVWQYTAHPEWLSRIREQPKSMEDSLAESEFNQSTIPQTTTPQLNQPLNLENLERGQDLNNPNGVNPSTLLQQRNNANSQPIETSNQPNINQSNVDNSQKPSFFQPVLPETNSNRLPVQSSPIQPVKPAPIQVENHLQKAINQQSQGRSNLNSYNQNPPNSLGTSGTLPELNINNRSSLSNPNLNSPQRVPQNNYQNNYLSQPVQPSTQPFQAPYNNYTTQPQSQLQQAQPPASSFQVPYNNYPTQSPNNNFSGQSNLSGQGNTVPYNSYSRPIPQIQPGIRESTSY